MPLIKPPVPQFQQSNPLARKLAHAWLMNHESMQAQGAHFTDYVNPLTFGKFGSGSGSTTGNYWRPGQRGYYIACDTTGTGTFASAVANVGLSSGDGFVSTSPFSWAGRFFLTTGSLIALYGLHPSGAYIRISSTNKLELIKATVALIGASTGVVPSNKWIDLGVTYDGTVASLYIDGNQSGTGSSAQTFATGQYAIFGGTDNPPPPDSGVEYTYIWNRVISASEMASLVSDPYQMFRTGAPDAALLSQQNAAPPPATSSTIFGWPGIIVGAKVMRGLIENPRTTRRRLLTGKW